jgi:Transposase DDE domain
MDTDQQALPQVSSGAAALVEEPQHLVGDIEQFVRDAIARLQPDVHEQLHGPGRPRILPALCLWAGLLVVVLQGGGSQLAIWRLLTARGLWDYPRFALSDQAIYKRMAAAGTSVLERLFAQISEILRERLAPFVLTDLVPWAKEVFALDETTLDPVARKLPALREVPAGDARLLPGKLAGLYDIRRQHWRRVQYIADPHENEKVAAAATVAALPLGSLILADLGDFAFAWFDALTDAGYWWLSHLRSKTSYEIRHVFYQDANILDAIVWLGAHRADRAAHAVRLLTVRLGDRSYSYIANVLDPTQLTALDMVRLYGRRWDIEMAINLVKTHLKLHLWWSAKTTVILQQLWAVLIIAQIIQALHLEIAGRAGVDPDEVSVALLIQYLPILAQDGRDPVAFFVEVGRQAHFIRPSTRIKRQIPFVPPDQIVPLPPDLVLVRTPRYAQRKVGRGEARK